MSDDRKSVLLSPEAHAVMEHQIAAFRKKFGRDPALTDPIFFDPDADDPKPIRQETQDEYERGIVEAMAAAGFDPALIYAFKRTGRIVTEENKRLLTEDEMAEWDHAIDEFRHKIHSGEVV